MSRARLTIAELAILALTGLGFALSYSSLVRLAEEHGYRGWEARAWPVTIDLLALAGTLLALELAARGSGPRREAWGLAVIAGVATLSGNVLSVWPDPVSMLLHSWPAWCMLSAWHVLMRAAVRGEAKRASIPLSHGNGHRASTAVRAQRLIKRLPDVSSAQLARHLEVSRSHAARLLRDARRPHVLEAEQ